MKDKPLLANVLLMLAYSALFTAMNAMFGDVFIGIHWAAVVLHAVVAWFLGLVYLSSSETRKKGGQYMLAGLVIAIIGHGLCIFNGTLNMGNIH